MESRTLGPYTLHEQLGSGGMGEVYKAYDERLDRWVAIKTIPPSREMTPEKRKRLRREAKAAAGLNHPSIAQVHDIIVEEDRDHIVMEYVEGRNLASILHDGALPMETVVEIARQVAEGLAAAHEHGIVHRDLKAENVMVSDAGRVKILDFGLAKRLDPNDGEESLTREGVVLGTCGAMSPEQAEGSDIDHRSDLFSFGTLLYCMASGRHPFSAASAVDTMRRVVFETPPPVNRINPKVPINIADLIEWLQQKKRDHRPASAREVVVALQAISLTWVSSSMATGQALTTPLRAMRQRRRRWTIIAIVVFLLLLIAGILALWLTRPGPPKVIAVLEPKLGENADPARAPYVSDTVRMAALNWIAGTRGLIAPDISEIDEISGGTKKIIRGVAASEALVFDIDSCQVTCTLQVRRISSEGTVIRSESYELSPDDLTASARAVATLLSHLYPGKRERSGVFDTIPSSEVLKSYLEIRAKYDNPPPGLDHRELLRELATLRHRAPRFAEISLLEARIARYLFEASYNAEYRDIAQAAIDRAKTFAPTDSRVLHTEFQLCRLIGDFDMARAAVDEMEANDPLNPDVQYCRHFIAQNEGKTELALEHLERMVQLRPSWKNYRRLAVFEWVDVGHVDDARTHLEEGLKLVPGSFYLSFDLAQLELFSGDLQRSLKLFNQLVEDCPDAITYHSLGTNLQLLGRNQEAIETFYKALSFSPDRPEIMMSIADSYELLGDSGTAEQWYRKATAAVEELDDPESAASLMIKAQCLAHLGMRTDAAMHAQKLLSKNPDEVMGHYSAALVYCVIGDNNAAAACAKNAIQHGMSARWFALPWFDAIRPQL